MSAVRWEKMKKVKLTHRVYTNISDSNFRKLQKVCKDYGFKSIYALLQTLLECFMDHVNQPQKEEPTINNEIGEMFEEMLQPQSYTYNKQKIGDYDGIASKSLASKFIQLDGEA